MGFGRLFVQAAEFAERFEPLLVFASLSVQLFCQCLYRQESPLVANGGASSAICRGLGRLQARFSFLIPLRALSSGFLRVARDSPGAFPERDFTEDRGKHLRTGGEPKVPVSRPSAPHWKMTRRVKLY